jgi:hypothetical protein
MVDGDTDRDARKDERQDQANKSESLGEKLKKLSDKIGCAANAPLENYGKRDD